MAIAVQGCVKGKVQGVGFRYFTLEQARAMGLKGYVQNLPDGSVAFLIQGEQVLIDNMLKKLHQGSAMACVTELNYETVNYDVTLGDFEIR